MELNLNAMYALMKASAPTMRDNGGGLIVNLGSMRDIPEGLNGAGGRISENVYLGPAYPTSKVAIFRHVHNGGTGARRGQHRRRHDEPGGAPRRASSTTLDASGGTRRWRHRGDAGKDDRVPGDLSGPPDLRSRVHRCCHVRAEKGLVPPL